MKLLKKLIFLICLLVIASSCQFTETLVLNEDGSGRMSLEMDMNEMMAFSGEMGDSTTTKMDTIVRMKDFLEEKKDSIALLPLAEQQQLKKMENYQIRMIMNTETSEMLFNVFTDFQNIEEANDLMSGLEKTSGMMPGVTSKPKNEDEASPDIIGIEFSYKNGKFSRNAFIKDKEQHRQQVDSIKSTEAFMSSMMYKLKYTFPRKIVKSSIEDATFSLDGKTIEVERSFVDYFKNPDVLDLQLELED